LISVPFGLVGTVWAFSKLKDIGVRQRSSVDWIGNLTFGLGLVALMIGLTYGIEPYGNQTMGWSSPTVIAALGAGTFLLGVFALAERRVRSPMFRLQLFRIRPFTAGIVASLLASIGRGGLMFMLVIWLQGVWLPKHGYDFASTPFWAGIYMR
jgi:hypothetical protein